MKRRLPVLELPIIETGFLGCYVLLFQDAAAKLLIMRSETTRVIMKSTMGNLPFAHLR